MDKASRVVRAGWHVCRANVVELKTAAVTRDEGTPFLISTEGSHLTVHVIAHAGKCHGWVATGDGPYPCVNAVLYRPLRAYANALSR